MAQEQSVVSNLLGNWCRLIVDATIKRETLPGDLGRLCVLMNLLHPKNKFSNMFEAIRDSGFYSLFTNIDKKKIENIFEDIEFKQADINFLPVPSRETACRILSSRHTLLPCLEKYLRTIAYPDMELLYICTK